MNGWQQVAPQSEGLSVMMPCTPQHHAVQATTVSDRPMEMDVYSCAQGNESYLVSATADTFSSQAQAQRP
jgi:hypothetical protein